MNINLSSGTTLVLLAIIALIGSILASVVGSWLTFKFGQMANKAAIAAQLATAKAQKDAATAQTSALEAAKQLVEVARTTAPILQEISDTGKATHNLVNNDRSIDKTNIARLTGLVAKLLPDDADAQIAAADAQTEANRYPKPTIKQ